MPTHAFVRMLACSVEDRSVQGAHLSCTQANKKGLKLIPGEGCNLADMGLRGSAFALVSKKSEQSEYLEEGTDIKVILLVQYHTISANITLNTCEMTSVQIRPCAESSLDRTITHMLSLTSTYPS